MSEPCLNLKYENEELNLSQTDLSLLVPALKNHIGSEIGRASMSTGRVRNITFKLERILSSMRNKTLK